ncbi:MULTISPECIES: hypothetical protein [unclassified Nocardioides]|uniref:hypothetical protein n=1 Tax=unclassified Nocardioides TaxID=2615069 RepID=UPI000702C0A0|nr:MULTISPECIES: hypothetical protein [unclassified Nocardioides]KRC53370.1 hypothetical protein ASE19_13545 [Nocardioides sp. Root79]KRC70707.1 hypothetical protein ASE20_12390 [Nocardioides sp. Root240]
MVGTTWKQAVADELARLYRPGQEFTLIEFYAGAEERLQAMYPDNTTVQATIRQILQRHRDARLLTFHGNGRYTYNGEHRRREQAEIPRNGLAEAVYQLAARITAETKIAATDYLAVARAPEPDQALRALVLGGHAGATFLALNATRRLDLSIERLAIELAGPHGLGADVVSAAADRLTYFESEPE